MLHTLENKPRKIERTIHGWLVSLEGDYIVILMPTGAKSKLHISAPVPSRLLISKETQVLTKNGMTYKTIQVVGPEIPMDVRRFISRLKKGIAFR